MGIFERLQRFDERVGLDSPHKRRERGERRAALDSLPGAMRHSLTRRRLVAIALIAAAVVAVSLLVLSFLPLGHDGWAVVTIVLSIIFATVGGLVGRRIERDLLEEHREGGGSER